MSFRKTARDLSRTHLILYSRVVHANNNGRHFWLFRTPTVATMKTIVFACKSNTCRSQMAEGWAKEWIRIHSSKQDTANTLVASIALDTKSAYNCDCADGEVCEVKSVKSKAVEAMALDGIDISAFTPKTLDQILPTIPRLPIDFLVVLCSCGVEETISQNCKHIRQWHVEAPTAAAKREGNDCAYRRVSLEIREHVHNLMEELHRGE